MAYHFWTKAMEKINHFRKASDPDPLDNVSSSKARTRILLTVRATEMYIFLSCVAMGILQGISVEFDSAHFIGKLRYQRTPAQKRPSEANIKHYLRHSFFVLLFQDPRHELTRIIQAAQSGNNIQNQRDVA